MKEGGLGALTIAMDVEGCEGEDNVEKSSKNKLQDSPYLNIQPVFIFMRMKDKINIPYLVHNMGCFKNMPPNFVHS